MSEVLTQNNPTFDAEQSEQFAEKMVEALNNSSLIFMTSIGHRTGLFDVMDAKPPLTSEEIAGEADLNERYVREWLGVMVTSGVVSYRPEDKTYLLPAEHAAWLTRRATPNNIAVTAQMLSPLGGMETDLIGCFKNGGGLPYDAYDRFHENMAEDSAQTVLAALFDHIIPVVPGLAERLEHGIRVLDAGCGQARALIKLAERYPNSHFVGFDLCEPPVAIARANAKRLGLSNISFEVRDLPGDNLGGPYDLVTSFDAVHDQRDPAGLLKAICDSLADDGVYLMQDIAGSSYLEKNIEHPIGPLIYSISTAHCTCVSLGQGGPGLGTMWGVELAEEMLGEAGFTQITQNTLPHDIFNVYFVSQKG